jgi:hypothetical protein
MIIDMKKVAMCIIVIAMIFVNVCLSPKLNSTNQSPLSLSLLEARADGGTGEDYLPPKDQDPTPLSLFPIDWSFSSIIDFFF